MKMKTIATSVLVTVLVGLWIADVRSDSWDGNSPVNFPQMEVGDSWVFKGFSSSHGSDTFREEIVGSGEGHFLLSHVSDKGGDDRVFTIIQSETYPRMKFIEALKFPLYVGKKWRVAYEGKSVTNVKHSYENKYKVLKVETKSVKAGKFKVFKIRLMHSVDGMRGGTKYIWYAPDVKRVILTKPSWRTGEELTSYELSSP